jgi:hypothetical protein
MVPGQVRQVSAQYFFDVYSSEEAKHTKESKSWLFVSSLINNISSSMQVTNGPKCHWHQAFAALCNVTLYPIGLILKLLIKWSVVSEVPERH